MSSRLSHAAPPALTAQTTMKYFAEQDELSSFRKVPMNDGPWNPEVVDILVKESKEDDVTIVVAEKHSNIPAHILAKLEAEEVEMEPVESFLMDPEDQDQDVLKGRVQQTE